MYLGKPCVEGISDLDVLQEINYHPGRSFADIDIDISRELKLDGVSTKIVPTPASTLLRALDSDQ